MKIVVVGSALMDIAVKHTDGFELFSEKGRKYFSIPYGSKIEVREIEMHVGGSGHNVAADLAKLGHHVSFVGKLGNDYLSKQILEDFRHDKVDIKNLRIVTNAKGGFSIIFLLPDGEKSIMVYNGYNLDLKPRDVPVPELEDAGWLVFTSVTTSSSLKFLRESIRIAKKNHVKILANPSIRMIKLRRKELIGFLKSADVAIMNREEITELTGKKSLVSSLKKLSRMGPRISVATVGSKGAVAFDGTKIVKENGYKVRIVDSTACGDSFTAGFLHYLLKGRGISESLRFANKSAALQCLYVGSESLPEKTILGFRPKN